MYELPVLPTSCRRLLSRRRRLRHPPPAVRALGRFRCAHGRRCGPGGWPGGCGLLRGRRGDDAGPARLLPAWPSPGSGLLLAVAARAERVRDGAVHGGPGGSRIRASRVRAAHAVTAASRPHRCPAPGPSSGWSRRPSRRGGPQWQQPRSGAWGGWPRREGRGRLGRWQLGCCEPQPWRQAHDPAGPDRVGGGERRCAGVLRGQDRQVRHCLDPHPPPPTHTHRHTHTGLEPADRWCLWSGFDSLPCLQCQRPEFQTIWLTVLMALAQPYVRDTSWYLSFINQQPTSSILFPEACLCHSHKRHPYLEVEVIAHPLEFWLHSCAVLLPLCSWCS